MAGSGLDERAPDRVLLREASDAQEEAGQEEHPSDGVVRSTRGERDPDDRHEDVHQHIQGDARVALDVFGQRNAPIEIQDDECPDDQRDGHQPDDPRERPGRCVLDTVHHEPILIPSRRYRKWDTITVRSGARSLPQIAVGVSGG